MNSAKMALIGVVVVFGAMTAQGGSLYKWVDKDGKVSYHDKPPPENAGYRVEQKEWQSAVATETNAADEFPVTLYTSPGCALCDAAKSYLERRGIPYSEKNVEANAELQKELKAKSGSLLVPTIIVGKRVMNSYVESLLAAELDQAGYPKMGASAPAGN